MKHNIPETIRVGAQDYKVVWENCVVTRQQFGAACGSELTITLDPSVPQTRLVQVLLHEIGECMNNEYALGLDEHHLILLEVAWAQVFRDNPELLQSLKVLGGGE